MNEIRCNGINYHCIIHEHTYKRGEKQTYEDSQSLLPSLLVLCGFLLFLLSHTLFVITHCCCLFLDRCHHHDYLFCFSSFHLLLWLLLLLVCLSSFFLIFLSFSFSLSLCFQAVCLQLIRMLLIQPRLFTFLL